MLANNVCQGLHDRLQHPPKPPISIANALLSHEDTNTGTRRKATDGTFRIETAQAPVEDRTQSRHHGSLDIKCLA